MSRDGRDRDPPNLRESPIDTAPLPSVVLFVVDVERVAAFYEAVGAMRRVTRDSEHAVLEIAGLQLVVHRLKGEPVPVRGSDGRAQAREDSYSKLCLPVQSIGEARMQAVALGGIIKPVDCEWQARGFRACDGHDPEGNVIQVRERAN